MKSKRVDCRSSKLISPVTRAKDYVVTQGFPAWHCLNVIDVTNTLDGCCSLQQSVLAVGPCGVDKGSHQSFDVSKPGEIVRALWH